MSEQQQSQNKYVPKNHLLWVSNYDKDHNLIDFITSDQARTKYFLFEIENGVAVKKDTAKTPAFFAKPSKK